MLSDEDSQLFRDITSFSYRQCLFNMTSDSGEFPEKREDLEKESLSRVGKTIRMNSIKRR